MLKGMDWNSVNADSVKTLYFPQESAGLQNQLGRPDPSEDREQ
jgi:hypothetical protein